ncbi:MAG: transglutaminase domain-containing protein [Bdellovibrionales bacterium]|nr:transglutaminase domain-containing protein [Bdellovibrionales bacterium]
MHSIERSHNSVDSQDLPRWWSSFNVASIGAFSFRLIGYLVALRLVHTSLDISTSLSTLMLAMFLGHVTGVTAAFSKIRDWVAPVAFCLTYIAIQLIFFAIEYFSSGSPQKVLEPFSLLLDINLTLAVIAIAHFTSWLYWRIHHYATLEAIMLLLTLVAYFAPHRDFQFSLAPKLIQTLAWELHTSSFALIVIGGGLSALILLFFLGITGHPARAEYHPSRAKTILVYGAQNPFSLTLLIVSILFLVGLTTRQVYYHYADFIASAGANGVGFQKSEESLGKSPLGFHSALGSNNQPAAMVRLDGDYRENPTSPMLYLREAALSSFNGRELVDAGKAYDDDVTYSSPSTAFVTSERMELFQRVPLLQSIYLLSDHDISFGVDYPLSMQPLQNPAPNRFRGAYKVYSIAPTFTYDELTGAPVGNPEWSEDITQHYLTPHTDSRYSELAHSLIDGIGLPNEQAKAIVQYLNKTAIYTLSPNHEVDPNEDPVAPFLFGDHRGYCVHFAHATVYMMRSIGIPSRIATGYLTDLSQAKDGHILLRMSDRHAWAEAYFANFGWVPFDTQPEQVESHADSDVDVNLLEELMGLVGPEKELLPENSELHESGLEDAHQWELPSLRSLWLVLLAIGFIFVLCKAYRWFSWILPANTKTRTQRAYSNLLARLTDLGLHRLSGETSQEYLTRIEREFGHHLDATWNQFRVLKYAASTHPSVNPRTAIMSDLKVFRHVHLLKRIFAFFNPASLLPQGGSR